MYDDLESEFVSEQYEYIDGRVRTKGLVLIMSLIVLLSGFLFGSMFVYVSYLRNEAYMSYVILTVKSLVESIGNEKVNETGYGDEESVRSTLRHIEESMENLIKTSDEVHYLVLEEHDNAEDLSIVIGDAGCYRSDEFPKKSAEDESSYSISCDAPGMDAVKKAFQGETGTLLYFNSRMIPVISAYSPFILNGRKFAILMIVDVLDIFYPFMVTLAVSLLLSVILILFGSILIRKLMAPVFHQLYANYRSIKNREKFVKNIIEVSQNGIMTTNHKGIIRVFNPACERIFGYERREVIGLHYTLLFPTDQRNNLMNALQAFLLDIKELKMHIPLFGELEAIRKDGGIVPVHYSMGFDENLMVIILTDITWHKNYERELLDLKERAEIANVAKSDFLNNISHELRTPQHAILSFAGFGMNKIDTVDRGKMLEYFSKINLSGNRLLNLVNDLLDISKLEAGKMDFNIETNNFKKLLSIVKDELSSLLIEKNLHLHVRVEPGTESAHFDINRMEQVVLNLLSNAIKFSPSGGNIYIVVRKSEKKNFVQFSIRDEGPGLEEKMIGKVFDKFTQIGKHNSGGTGLGLAICKEIISWHNGVIQARNHPHGGAQFAFQIPDYQGEKHVA